MRPKVSIHPHFQPHSAQEQGYTLMITADHGNAEETFDPKISQAITSHTLNPVPFYFISPKYAKIKREQGDLSDVAPTILTILDLKIPEYLFFVN